MIREDIVIEPLPKRAGVREFTAPAARRLRTGIVQARNHRRWAIPLVGFGIAAAAVAVYLTGGTSRGFTLLFLLPILAGAYSAGPVGGALTGLVAATVATVLPFGGGSTQLVETESVRYVVFALVGLVTGGFVAAFAHELEGRTRLRREATRTLWRLLEVHDHDSAAHAERVSAYAEAIARELDLPAEQLERIRDGALLHNIGRLAVPEGSTLTPLVSEHVLRESLELEPLVPIIRSHHERWDGTGYPDRLHSHQIPLEARIVKVANAYDNLTYTDGEHPADEPADALARIRSQAGGRFDPDVVDALERIFSRWRVALPPDFFLARSLDFRPR